MKKSGISFALLGLLVLAMAGVPNRYGKSYSDELFQRTLITFTFTQTLSGIISVFQSTQFALQPAGVGVNFSAGEILGPLKNLLQKFSGILVACLIFAGFQKLLLQFTSSFFMMIILATAIFYLLISLWFTKKTWKEFTKQFSVRSCLVVLVFYLFVPFTAACSAIVDFFYFQGEYQKNYQIVQTTGQQIDEEVPIDQGPAEVKTGLLERWKQFFSNHLNLKEKINRIKSQAQILGEKIINLIILFLIQTIVFPVVSWFSLGKILRWPGKGLSG